ncbi:MAG: hypothetical protein EOO04_12410 [Chitinophagaceae bacterium]|nr:MAG: hypothetical protein EOO04_12410 [Chitinophagaceae bacterium]
MKAKILFNVLAVLGLAATVVTLYFFYDYNRREGISPVLVWGTSPILVFIVITSFFQLRKSLRTHKRR